MKVATGPLFVNFSLARPGVHNVKQLSQGSRFDRVKAAVLSPIAAIILPASDACSHIGLALGKSALLVAPITMGRLVGKDLRQSLDPRSPRKALLSQMAFHVRRSLASLCLATACTVAIPFIILRPFLVARPHHNLGLDRVFNEKCVTRQPPLKDRPLPLKNRLVTPATQPHKKDPTTNKSQTPAKPIPQKPQPPAGSNTNKQEPKPKEIKKPNILDNIVADTAWKGRKATDPLLSPLEALTPTPPHVTPGSPKKLGSPSKTPSIVPPSSPTRGVAFNIPDEHKRPADVKGGGLDKLRKRSERRGKALEEAMKEDGSGTEKKPPAVSLSKLRERSARASLLLENTQQPLTAAAEITPALPPSLAHSHHKDLPPPASPLPQPKALLQNSPPLNAPQSIVKPASPKGKADPALMPTHQAQQKEEGAGQKENDPTVNQVNVQAEKQDGKGADIQSKIPSGSTLKSRFSSILGKSDKAGAALLAVDQNAQFVQQTPQTTSLAKIKDRSAKAATALKAAH